MGQNTYIGEFSSIINGSTMQNTQRIHCFNRKRCNLIFSESSHIFLSGYLLDIDLENAVDIWYV